MKLNWLRTAGILCSMGILCGCRITSVSEPAGQAGERPPGAVDTIDIEAYSLPGEIDLFLERLQAGFLDKEQLTIIYIQTEGDSIVFEIMKEKEPVAELVIDGFQKENGAVIRQTVCGMWSDTQQEQMAIYLFCAYDPELTEHEARNRSRMIKDLDPELGYFEKDTIYRYENGTYIIEKQPLISANQIELLLKADLLEENKWEIRKEEIEKDSITYYFADEYGHLPFSLELTLTEDEYVTRLRLRTERELLNDELAAFQIAAVYLVQANDRESDMDSAYQIISEAGRLYWREGTPYSSGGKEYLYRTVNGSPEFIITNIP